MTNPATTSATTSIDTTTSDNAVDHSKVQPMRLSGLEPVFIDEKTLFVNVGERTNVTGLVMAHLAKNH